MTTLPARALDLAEWSTMPRLRDLQPPARVRVGDLITLRSRGAWRLARVTKVGRERVYTEYTTESALAEAERYGTPPTVTRKSIRIDDDFVRYAGKG